VYLADGESIRSRKPNLNYSKSAYDIASTTKLTLRVTAKQREVQAKRTKVTVTEPGESKLTLIVAEAYFAF